MTKEDALKKLDEEVSKLDYKQVVTQSPTIKGWIKASIIDKYKLKKECVYHQINANVILSGNRSTLLKKIDNEFAKATRILKIPIADLKLHNDPYAYNYGSSFYIRGFKYETEAKMQARINRAVTSAYLKIKNKAKADFDKIKKRETKERQKRQETIKLAKKLMKELGADVYEIFNEIQKNKK